MDRDGTEGAYNHHITGIQWLPLTGSHIEWVKTRSISNGGNTNSFGTLCKPDVVHKQFQSSYDKHNVGLSSYHEMHLESLSFPQPFPQYEQHYTNPILHSPWDNIHKPNIIPLVVLTSQERPSNIYVNTFFLPSCYFPPSLLPINFGGILPNTRHGTRQTRKKSVSNYIYKNLKFAALMVFPKRRQEAHSKLSYKSPLMLIYAPPSGESGLSNECGNHGPINKNNNTE